MTDATIAKSSIVLCHGIWLDGSCFSKVIPPLQAVGYEVVAAQYGLDTPEDDVAAVARTLDRVKSPCILVGHSYGGRVITAAGTDARVAALVYVAAYAPDVGETSQRRENFPVPDVENYIEVEEGRAWLLHGGVACLAEDISAEEQRLLFATQQPPSVVLNSRNAPGTAWKSKPTWYVVSGKDRTIAPDLQRFLAKRMGANVTELDSSHMSILSHPDVVADVIVKAASSLS